MAKAITDFKAHLLSRITVTQTGCWEWQGARTKGGYGSVTRRRLYTHRLAFEVWCGPIPPGMEVCHDCDNPPCINPDHLFSGTRKDNIVDAARKSRMRNKFTADQVVAIRTSVLTNAALASEFGVAPSAISNVRTRTYYKYIA